MPTHPPQLTELIARREKLFDDSFPRDMREVYKQGDGSWSAGVVKMNVVIKSFLTTTAREAWEAGVRAAIDCVDIMELARVDKDFSQYSNGKFSTNVADKIEGYNRSVADIKSAIARLIPKRE